jgi:transmembrane sensor
MEPHVEDITQFAADWYTRMHSGDLTHRDYEQFVHWLASDPANREEYAALEMVWSSLETVKDSVCVNDAEDKSSWSEWTHAIIERIKESLIITVPMATAVVAVIVTLFLFSANDVQIYTTARGEQIAVELNDDSSINLNSDTELIVKFTDDYRTVELVRGQAFFTVAHDPLRPFVVKAGNGEVRAIGTAFDVEKMEELITVTVLEGRVEVLQMFNSAEIQINRREEIKANEQVSFAEVGTLSKAQFVDPNEAFSWRTGMIDFDNQPLSEVIEKMNRYSAKQIILVDAEVKSLRISGVFKIGDSDALIRALEKRFHINATDINDSKTLILKTKDSG